MIGCADWVLSQIRSGDRSGSRMSHNVACCSRTRTSVGHAGPDACTRHCRSTLTAEARSRWRNQGLQPASYPMGLSCLSQLADFLFPDLASHRVHRRSNRLCHTCGFESSFRVKKHLSLDGLVKQIDSTHGQASLKEPQGSPAPVHVIVSAFSFSSSGDALSIRLLSSPKPSFESQNNPLKSFAHLPAFGSIPFSSRPQR